jgi:hypothetical protein
LNFYFSKVEELYAKTRFCCFLIRLFWWGGGGVVCGWLVTDVREQ